MGEVFFRRIFLTLFFVICFVFFFSFSIPVLAANHPLYSSFSSAESGFTFNNVSNLISVGDTAIYRIGYYSVNGSAWQNFTLTGTFYNGDANWLSGSSSRSLPFFGTGEHYIIVYSCTYSNNSWDCHDNRWQLITINNSAFSSSCNDSCALLGYECGYSIICESNTSCGNCPSGYNCTNNVCIMSQNGTCGGATCKTGEYCSNNVCLLRVPGNTYFVSTNGNDNNPGNFSHPWATWKKGMQSAQPGDIVYFRGGTYMASGTAGNYIEINHVEGTKENQVYFFNYPGETPILDGSLLSPGTLGYNTAIGAGYSHWFNFRGLTVQNFHQYVPAGGDRTQVSIGFGAYGCSNFHYENCVARDINGRGFYYISIGNEGGWNKPDNSSWINCDSYNLVDSLSYSTLEDGTIFHNEGNAADGYFLQVLGVNGGTALIEGCRAWNVSDDGFNIDGDAYFEIKNCWSFNNYYPSMHSNEGNGFKLDTGYATDENLRTVSNCIAANNPGMGFDTNNGGDSWPRHRLYNLLSYDNLLGNIVQNCDETPTPPASVNVVRNMISYKDSWGAFENVPRLQGRTDYLFTEDHNTWRTIYQYPYWENNPAYTVTDADFISLDVNQLSRPRKADGSLPDVTFGHLTAGSDLIDGGVDVGLPFNGAAPDLGPFEYP